MSSKPNTFCDICMISALSMLIVQWKSDILTAKVDSMYFWVTAVQDFKTISWEVYLASIYGKLN